MGNNYTYILKCSDGSLYCGWTNNLEKNKKRPCGRFYFWRRRCKLADIYNSSRFIRSVE